MDKWKNRNKNMSCETCMYFVVKEPELPEPSQDAVKFNCIGRCRRHAPTLKGYPVVFMKDWCGDHKIDEDKI